MAARRRLQFIVRAHLFAISYGTELQLYALFALLAKLWGTLRKKKKGKAEIRFPLVDGAEDAFMASRARQASGKTLATKSRLQPRKTRLLQGAPTSAVAGPAALFFARAHSSRSRRARVKRRRHAALGPEGLLGRAAAQKGTHQNNLSGKPGDFVRATASQPRRRPSFIFSSR